MTPKRVLACAAIMLGGACVGPAKASGSSELRIAIQLRPLANEEVGSTEVEVAFLNVGQRELKIPLMAGGGFNGMFFDFVFVGSLGGFETLSGSGGAWHDPVVKPVELVLLTPGQPHLVTLHMPLPKLEAVQVWWVLAIYRDCRYGHSPTYPEYGADHSDVWHGAAASNLAPMVQLPNTTQQPTSAPSGARG